MAEIRARHAVDEFDSSEMARLILHRLSEKLIRPCLNLMLKPTVSTRVAAHRAIRALGFGQPRMLVR